MPPGRARRSAPELFGILFRTSGPSLAASEEICSMFGFGLKAYDEVLLIGASTSRPLADKALTIRKRLRMVAEIG